MICFLLADDLIDSLFESEKVYLFPEPHSDDLESGRKVTLDRKTLNLIRS